MGAPGPPGAFPSGPPAGAPAASPVLSSCVVSPFNLTSAPSYSSELQVADVSVRGGSDEYIKIQIIPEKLSQWQEYNTGSGCTAEYGLPYQTGTF